MKKYLLLLIPLALVGCKQIDFTPSVEYHSPKGPSNAQVRIAEWGDFQCPACRSAFMALRPTFEKYSERIQVQFRHFPLTSIHPLAFNAATGAECAAEQGKFWEMHDALYENQPALKKADMVRYAEQLDMDTEAFSNCFDSKVKNDVVKNDIDEGRQLGLNSTPTFFINDQKISDWTTIPALLASYFPDQDTASTTDEDGEAMDTGSDES